jgi:hypothetical protein
MVRLVTFSVGSIFLGLVAAVGLAVYTSARPLDVGLLGTLSAESASRPVAPALGDCASARGSDGSGPRRRTLG